MAVVAVVATRDMGRVLAGRRGAVVARTAGTDDLGMVYGNDWLKDKRTVAVLADICGRHMDRTLADCRCTVMARDAIVDNARMVETCGQPRSGTVAIVTLIAA